MGLLDRFKFGRQDFIEKQTMIPGVTETDSCYIVDTALSVSSNSFIPTYNENYNRNNDWVPFGPSNNIPDQLADLYNSSPLHASIIDLKSKIMSGDGIDYTGISDIDKIKIDSILNNGDSITYKLREWSLDYQIFGAYTMEITKNSVNPSLISKISRIPTINIRLGRENVYNKSDYYYYSKDWKYSYNAPVRPIAAYDVKDLNNLIQAKYVKNPSMDGRYYGRPAYTSGLNSIAADAAISVYQLDVIENGFSAGMVIKYFKRPDSPEERREIVRGLESQVTGKRGKKFVVMFSNGKELAPEITPIDISNLDKQFTVLSSSIDSKILQSHNAISPILFSIQTAGKLGTTNEFQNAYNLLDRLVISNDRKILEEQINTLLEVNGLPAIKIKPMVVFDRPIADQPQQTTQHIVQNITSTNG